MTRVTDSCMLGAYLEANARKPEEQATAVLACALYSSPSLTRALLDLLSVPEVGQVDVETEVATGHDRDHIDLQIRVLGDRGELRRRVWVEVKINALLGEDREGQLVRYRKALTDRDDQHGSVMPSLLVFLAPSVEDRARLQVEAVKPTVLHWQRVGDLAADRARDLAGNDWRTAARESHASLEVANLETLVWFLEAGTAKDANGDRKEIVGISMTDPLRSELLEQYAASYRAVRTVRAVGERVAQRFEDKGWSTEEAEATGGDDTAMDCVSILFGLEDPRKTGWWHAFDSAAMFSIMPVDEREPPKIEGPSIWAGVAFDDENGQLPRGSAEWFERADAASLT